jgi:hypothetical protein
LQRFPRYPATATPFSKRFGADLISEINIFRSKYRMAYGGIENERKIWNNFTNRMLSLRNIDIMPAIHPIATNKPPIKKSTQPYKPLKLKIPT